MVSGPPDRIGHPGHLPNDPKRPCLAFALLAWLMLPTTAMTNHNDTAGPPFLYLDAIPVPVRAEEPARAALAALQSRLPTSFG